MKYWKSQNFLKGLITSLIGLTLIAAGAFWLFKAIADGEDVLGEVIEAVGLMGTGAYLLGIKDPHLPKMKFPKKGKGAALMLALALTLSGCVTLKKCTDKFGTGDAHIVHDTLIREVPAVTPPDSLSGGIKDDQLADLMSGKIDSLTFLSESQKVQTKFWYDKYNRELRHRTDVKPDTIIVRDTVYLETPCPKTVILDPSKEQSIGQVWWENYKSFAALALLALIVALIMIGKWQKLKGGRA